MGNLIDAFSPRTEIWGQYSQLWWGYEPIFIIAKLSRLQFSWIVNNASIRSVMASIKKKGGGGSYFQDKTNLYFILTPLLPFLSTDTGQGVGGSMKVIAIIMDPITTSKGVGIKQRRERLEIWGRRMGRTNSRMGREQFMIT